MKEPRRYSTFQNIILSESLVSEMFSVTHVITEFV
jgi:hypothetical protein